MALCLLTSDSVCSQVLILFLSSPRSGTTRFGEILRTLNVRFFEEPFNPGAYSGLGFYSDLFTLSAEGRRLACHPGLAADLVPSPVAGFARRKSARLLLKTSVKLESMASRHLAWSFLKPTSLSLRRLSHEAIPPVNPFRMEGVPRKIAELLHASEHTYVLEIFPTHLDSEEDLEFLCGTYPSMILQRRLIDSYVSFVKAKGVKVWHDADTTSKQVSIDAPSFVAYCKRMTRWYERYIRYRNVYFDSLPDEDPLNAARHAVLNYEEWGCYGNQQQPREVFLLLGQMGFKDFIKPPVASVGEGSMRQDRSQDWSTKILNPELLQKNLEDISSAHLLLESPLPTDARHGSR